MDIIWTKDNYKIEKTLGASLRGLRYGNSRPDKIIIYMDELENTDFLLTPEGRSNLFHYLDREAIVCINNKDVILKKR